MKDRNNIIRCKDIPDEPILRFLYFRKRHNKLWACWFDGFENSIGQAMPSNIPDNTKIKKMRTLIQKGLVNGCGCGCRGDYVITPKGVKFLFNKIANKI
jgi:hypothetical protein